MISRRQAKRALELHSEELSEFPNVVAVGVSRDDSRDRPAAESDHAVAVYVSEKLSEDLLEPDGVLPGYVEIPGRGTTHKVAVKIIEIGAVETQHGTEGGHSAFSAQ